MKNRDAFIVSLSTLDDIVKISSETKYLNIDITNPNHDLIAYLKKMGSYYKYGTLIDNQMGYNYTDYLVFKKAETIIDMIIAGIPNDLSKLALARYLYISVSKCLAYDINIDSSNEYYDLSLISDANNIWSALYLGIVSSYTAAKIFYYLCHRFNIKAEIVYQDDDAICQLSINNQIINTNLYKDIPFVKANMETRFFQNYNNDILLDKQVHYVSDKYNDYYLDKIFKSTNYQEADFLLKILNKITEVIDVSDIDPSSLKVLYTDIFNKYCANYEIKINDLFINDDTKQHFIMISINDNNYSYNYKDKCYMLVKTNVINEKIIDGIIGLYYDDAKVGRIY